MKRLLGKIFNYITDQNKVYTFDDVAHFCSKYDQKYIRIKSSYESEEMRVSYWGSGKENHKVKKIMPERYIAELENVTVFGESDLILAKGTVLQDMMTCKYAEHMNFQKGMVKEINIQERKVRLCYRYYRSFPIEKAIFLVGMFSFNYYHFMINLLPRLYYIYTNDEYIDYPIIIDERAYSRYKNVIELLNIHDRKIICLKANVAYKVKKLIMTAHIAWIDKYNTDVFPAHLYDKIAVKYIREYILSKIQSTENQERIYVSRSKLTADRQRLINEVEVENLFCKYGFVPVYPENMTFEQQVKVFSKAKFFAGTTGGAFTNILYLPDNATVICNTCLFNGDEMSGYNMYPSLWNTIASGQFYFLKCDETEESKLNIVKDNQKRFHMDIKYAEDFLRAILK